MNTKTNDKNTTASKAANKKPETAKTGTVSKETVKDKAATDADLKDKTNETSGSESIKIKKVEDVEKTETKTADSKDDETSKKLDDVTDTTVVDKSNEETNEETKVVVRTPISLLKQGITNYIKNMSPDNYIRPNAGVNHQMNLLHILKTVGNLQDTDEFKECWDFINNLVADNATGCFASQYLFRHLTIWPGNSRTLKSYTNLIDLLVLLAPMKTRKNNKRKINIERCLDPKLTDITERMAINIRYYYNYR